MTRIYLYLAILTMTFSSCGNFLEEYSQSLAYANSCTDLDELLVGEGYMKQMEVPGGSDVPLVGDNAPYFPWLHVMDDDVDEFYSSNSSLSSPYILSGFYGWQKDPFTSKEIPVQDITWSRLYAHINVLNVILPKVDEFMNDPEELRKRVKGEAYFLRASYYYWLVNFYAKPYSKTSATTDPGVPLKLTEYVDDKYYTRNSVDEVYNQIIRDLKAAIENLSGMRPANIHQAGESAAMALLSRVYLYTERWQECVDLCDKILKKGYVLVDLNAHDTTTSVNTITSPETIFTQGTNSMQFISMYPNKYVNHYNPSQALLKVYDQNDMRPKNFFPIIKTPWFGTHMLIRKTKITGSYPGADIPAHEVSDNSLIRLPEIYLNKAEALAMLGTRDGDAAKTLQDLRVTRYATGTVGTITQTGKELVELIRKERRLELCFEGHRWFDLRRYAVNSKYPYSEPIVHKYHDYGGTGKLKGSYTLKKYAEDRGGYVLPIPAYDIIFNSGKLEQNERENRVPTNN